MTDKLSKERRSWNMSRIRGKDTKPELLLRSLLHRSGYRFRVHYSKLAGRPDIVLPKYRTAIFVHGCFWHRHPGCPKAATPSSNKDFWTNKFEATIARDRKNIADIEAAGWKALTVWECELERDPDKALISVRKNLEGHL